MRIGIGYDSHRFSPDRPLVLGGATIPDAPGLAGHSDADAVAHALTDAILGAAAMGDIGTLFPDSDPTWKDASSLELLGDAYARVRKSGLALVNADVTVLLEQPPLSGHIAQMRTNLAQTLACDPSAISVKATTNEGMGFIGRGEGIAVIAVALVD